MADAELRRAKREGGDEAVAEVMKRRMRAGELGRAVSERELKREPATFAEVTENARSQDRFFPSFLDDLFSGTRLLPAGVFPISWFKYVGVVDRSDEDSRYYDENAPKSSLRVMLNDDDFDTRLPFSSSGFGWSPCGGGWRKNMHRSEF